MNPKKLVDRTQALGSVKKALEQIGQQAGSLVAEGGNAYALPYVTGLTDAPMTSSRFKLEDEEIPFYQLVVTAASVIRGRHTISPHIPMQGNMC